jgi:hypothetical protein
MDMATAVLWDKVAGAMSIVHRSCGWGATSLMVNRAWRCPTTVDPDIEIVFVLVIAAHIDEALKFTFSNKAANKSLLLHSQGCSWEVGGGWVPQSLARAGC